jgi:hypothetical protein
MKNKWKSILTEEFLREQHHILKKNPSRIAKDICCDPATVIRYMENYKIDIIYDKSKHGRKKGDHRRWKGYGDISRTFWRNIEGSGKTRKIPVSITIEDGWNLFLKQKRKCALTGVDIGFFGCFSNSASLDRIDATKGYSIDNVQWVHKDVNYAKQSLNNNDFIELCRSVVNYFDNKL